MAQRESFPHPNGDSRPRIWGLWKEPFGCHLSLFPVVQHMKDFMDSFGTAFPRLTEALVETHSQFSVSPQSLPGMVP